MIVQLLPEDSNAIKYPELEFNQPTRTYAINFANGTVRGFTDGTEAMKQAIFKCLQTHRFGFDIYNDDYGFELAGLLGKDFEYVACEMKRRVCDALFVDQRIKSVEHFSIVAGDAPDTMQVSFLVQTVFGDIEEQIEVLLK